MELLDAIRGRRTIRHYSDRSIEEDVLDQILEAAQWAPSACNRQLWEFVVVDDEKIRMRIALPAKTYLA